MQTTTFSPLPIGRQKVMFYILLGAGLLLTGLLSGAAISAKGWLPFGDAGASIVSLTNHSGHSARIRSATSSSAANRPATSNKRRAASGHRPKIVDACFRVASVPA